MRRLNTIWRRTNLVRSSGTSAWRPPLKKATAATTTVVCFTIFIVAAIFSSSWIGSIQSVVYVRSLKNKSVAEEKEQRNIPRKIQIPRRRIEFPLNCSAAVNATEACSSNYPTSFETEGGENSTCPEYFRWIHEDLEPFKATGISREMVESAKRTAHFRLVIVGGKVYVEKFKKSIQTRDAFTLWGILQLLRRYPGSLPDLELMFDCDDQPVVKARDFRLRPAPPLFRYCGDQWTMDIVFPDWSFWGWAEINIRPWENMLKELKEGNQRASWIEREPYAYWKGNPFVAETRQDLLTCNLTQKDDWNARLFVQDWILESKQGYKQSNLASQCTYRYKIYIEGFAWSVSEKYILACDSVSLLVKPNFYDFFTRSLMPVQHYWPIRHDDKCKSIKFAVDWGNNHKQKAQAIGKAASDFIQEEVKMENVYDYMFHLLNEYARLLKFKPKVPEGATELCSEKMACRGAEGLEKRFKLESLVKRPSRQSPCTLPPPYERNVLGGLLKRKANSIKQVELWETKYWFNNSHA